MLGSGWACKVRLRSERGAGRGVKNWEGVSRGVELEAPKEDQGVRDSKLESVVTCRNSGFSVGMHTRIQGPGTSELSVGSACLCKWG